MHFPHGYSLTYSQLMYGVPFEYDGGDGPEPGGDARIRQPCIAIGHFEGCGRDSISIPKSGRFHVIVGLNGFHAGADGPLIANPQEFVVDIPMMGSDLAKRVRAAAKQSIAEHERGYDDFMRHIATHVAEIGFTGAEIKRMMDGWGDDPERTARFLWAVGTQIDLKHAPANRPYAPWGGIGRPLSLGSSSPARTAE